MPTLQTFLSVCSGIIFVVAFFPYVRAILRKETSPRKATWLVWALGDIIILTGMIVKGTVSGLMVAAVAGATTVFILSLIFGESGWKTRDKVCVILSLMAIGLWLYFGDSNIGIGLSLTALAIAVWPTYVSAWEKPENEDKKTWVLFNLANIFAVLAIPSWTFADASSPFTFMAIDVPMLYLLFIRPNTQKRKVEAV